MDSARDLVLKGEHPVATTCLGDQRVCGVADYVIGYCHAASTGRDSILESISVVIEAKRRYKTDQGIPQMILYLSRVQQSRAKLRPEKIMKTVSGILTDSIEFRFFGLDEDHCLCISKLFTTVNDYDKQEM